jgi:hypothetical protein
MEEEKVKRFETFGYEDTERGCDICGRRPARMEPRFLYRVCIHHFHLPPTEIGEMIDKRENPPEP